jgi:hypothetical protein
MDIIDDVRGASLKAAGMDDRDLDGERRLARVCCRGNPVLASRPEAVSLVRSRLDRVLSGEISSRCKTDILSDRPCHLVLDLPVGRHKLLKLLPMEVGIAVAGKLYDV